MIRLYMSQNHLAEAIGQAQATVRRWVNRIPGIRLDPLSKFVEVGPDELVAFSALSWLKASTAIPGEAVRGVAGAILEELKSGGSCFLWVAVGAPFAGLGSREHQDDYPGRVIWFNLRKYHRTMARLVRDEVKLQRTSPKQEVLKLRLPKLPELEVA